jgi:C1A family cysteine protease
MTTKRYGWVPDLPDHRDLLYAAPVAALAALPAKVDLTPQCPAKVYDQGQLGSCTANAIAATLEFDMMKEKLPSIVTPSRLFIYFNEREKEHTVQEDAGAQIRDGIKVVNKLGACPEPMWVYDDANPGRFQERPTKECYTEALKHKALTYHRVARTLAQMRSCLASGYPFVFGFSVYDSFESDKVAKTGVVPMPGANEALLGGHAVLAVGYDDASQRFIVRNSWGPTWGMKGYFTLPYAYLLDSNLSDDFWTIRTVARG